MVKRPPAAKQDFTQAQKIDSPNLAAHFLAEWSGICQERPDQTQAERLEIIAATDSQHLIAYFCRAIALCLHNRFEEASAELEQISGLESNWNAAYFFWTGMIYASQKKDEESIMAIEEALNADLPPILLAPVRWLKDDRLVFYNKYAMPLLIRYEITEASIITEKQTQ